MELVVRTDGWGSPASQAVEVVERKGLGHPDTICDALAEHLCVRLCRYYIDHFGVILHHNVDKLLLCGGASRAEFGGGEVVEPIEIYVAGRAAQEYEGKSIPLNEIAEQACRDWLRAHLLDLDVDRHVRIIPRLRPGSADLTRLFARGGANALANDTSCGAGFAPLTDLERVVLEVERTLNSPETKRISPEIGTDIKVMGVRRDASIVLTIGCAYVGRYVSDIDDYAAKKVGTKQIALQTARRGTRCDVDAFVNAADDFDRENGFLTVTGTSAEAGDDGEVGRGNRTSGLITPYRPMTLEAAAGKNPVSHVGKLYNLVSARITNAIVADLPMMSSAACVLVSQIGRPVADPQIVDVQLGVTGTVSYGSLSGSVDGIVREELGRISELRDALLDGRVQVY